MSSSICQDMHISQNYLYPVFANSSFAGDIEKGNIQFGTLYRNQAFTVTPNPYNTYFIFANGKIEPRILNGNNIGIALLVLKDNSGKGGLVTDKTTLNIAYHFNFASVIRSFSFGTKLEYISRRFNNFGAFSFEEDLIGAGFSEKGIYNNNYLDFGLGTSLIVRIYKQTNLKLGLSANNISFGTKGLNSGSLRIFGVLYNAFIEMRTPLNENLYFLPKVFYAKTHKQKEIQVQSLLSYDYNNVDLKAGVGLRVDDAMQILLGADFENWEIGVAYDINISDLAVVSRYGSGFEIGVKYSYAASKYFRKTVDFPRIFLKPKAEVKKPQNAELKEIELKKKDIKKEDVKRDHPIVLKDIFFEYDKAEIPLESKSELIQLLRLLNKNKDIIIEISSHTDCRGSDKYNLALSQRRAEAINKWFTDRGIDSDRIKAKGYGETRLLNHCKDGVQCTESEHKVNRRTEFVIIGRATTTKLKK